MLTMTGEEATFTVAGRVVVPGVTATVFTMVVPAGTLSTVGAEEGGIFWVAAAAAANAAMPLICGLLPITCGGHGACEPQGARGPGPPSSLLQTSPGNLLPTQGSMLLAAVPQLSRPQTWTPTTEQAQGPQGRRLPAALDLSYRPQSERLLPLSLD